jgi:hypothetical protein
VAVWKRIKQRGFGVVTSGPSLENKKFTLLKSHLYFYFTFLFLLQLLNKLIFLFTILFLFLLLEKNLFSFESKQIRISISIPITHIPLQQLVIAKLQKKNKTSGYVGIRSIENKYFHT